jgi:(p)ppGpp synthase/HD superfamily hydrolase
MDEALQKIRDYADAAHGRQERKYSSERYIAHPVRVMEMCRKHTDSLPILAAALLHDVLEDTPVSLKEMKHFLKDTIESADADQTAVLVVELTDVYTKHSYPRWNRAKRKRKEAARIGKTSADAQTVKYADIIDNCREIVDHDPDFAKVFLKECRSLLQAMPSGNPVLYSEAKALVDRCLQQLAR